MSAEVHCNCIDETDDWLAKADEGARPSEKNNTKLLVNMFGPAKAFVATIKRDESMRKKAILCIATYCPFCGLKYGDKPAVAA